MTAPTWHQTRPAAAFVARNASDADDLRLLLDMLGLVDDAGRIRPDDTATYALVDPGAGPGAQNPDATNPRAFVEHGRRPDGMTTPDGLATLTPIVQQPPSKPKKQPAHGTRAGFRAHKRDGETVCQECRDAENTYNREYQASKRGVPQCGTYSGFMSHRRRGTEACEPCAQASRDYRRDYMQKYRTRKAAS